MDMSSVDSSIQMIREITTRWQRNEIVFYRGEDQFTLSAFLSSHKS